MVGAFDFAEKEIECCTTQMDSVACGYAKPCVPRVAVPSLHRHESLALDKRAHLHFEDVALIYKSTQFVLCKFSQRSEDCALRPPKNIEDHSRSIVAITEPVTVRDSASCFETCRGIRDYDCRKPRLTFVSRP